MMGFSSILRYLIVSSKGSFIYYMSSADCKWSNHIYMTLEFCYQSQMSSFLFYHSLSKD